MQSALDAHNGPKVKAHNQNQGQPPLKKVIKDLMQKMTRTPGESQAKSSQEPFGSMRLLAEDTEEPKNSSRAAPEQLLEGLLRDPTKASPAALQALVQLEMLKLLKEKKGQRLGRESARRSKTTTTTRSGCSKTR